MNSSVSRLRLSRPMATCHSYPPPFRPSRSGLTSQFIQPFTRRNLISEFSGLTLSTKPPTPTARRTNGFIVEANAKDSLGSRTGVGTKRKRRRVSGFRARMRTPGGRRVLKRRRKRGRKILCPASIRPAKERFTKKY